MHAPRVHASQDPARTLDVVPDVATAVANEVAGEARAVHEDEGRRHLRIPPRNLTKDPPRILRAKFYLPPRGVHQLPRKAVANQG